MGCKRVWRAVPVFKLELNHLLGNMDRVRIKGQSKLMVIHGDTDIIRVDAEDPWYQLSEVVCLKRQCPVAEYTSSVRVTLPPCGLVRNNTSFFTLEKTI